MTVPAPEPEAPAGGPLAHFMAALAKHLDPYLDDVRAELADARIKAENALGAAKKLSPVIQEAVSIVQEAVKTLDPADAPAAASLIERAGALAAKAAEIGTEIAAL